MGKSLIPVAVRLRSISCDDRLLLLEVYDANDFVIKVSDQCYDFTQGNIYDIDVALLAKDLGNYESFVKAIHKAKETFLKKRDLERELRWSEGKEDD